jgi:hypothetical protein
MKFENFENQLCELTNNYEQIILVIVFLVGYFFFKFFVFKEKNSHLDVNGNQLNKEEKIKISQEYLNEHEQELEEFFQS